MEKCSNIMNKMHGIRWAIQNASKIKCGMKVIGPNFYLEHECTFQISFMRNAEVICVYLRNKLDSEITIERTIVLCDYSDKKLHEENNIKIFSLKKDEDVDVIGLVEPEILKHLPNDVLIIDLCVSIKEIVGKKLICDLNPDRRLKEDFKTMLENPVNSDVCLQVGDERIPVHWAILCARSPYFKRMFDSGMKESVKNSVTITDSSFGTVKKLIQFLYTADLIQGDDLLQELFDLYYSSDKYEVLDLRALCGHKIVSNATIDNVCEILQLFHRHDDKDLKKEAISFIRSHSGAVFATEGWKKFEITEPVIAEFISYCLEKK